jgi:hypothetical protein
MLRLNNTFVRAPSLGAAFDANNDLYVLPCGTRVLHRDGRVTHGNDTSLHGLAYRALREYNSRRAARPAPVSTELESLVSAIASRRGVTLPPVKGSRP